MARLDGRVAVVTGASSGLGARFVRVLAAAGAHVVAGARRGDRLAALAAELPAVTPVTCDVTRAGDREALVAAALDAHGKVDVLVNGAGIGDHGPAEDEDLATFARVVEVNLVALFALTQLAVRPMLERGSGAVVNVASVHGLVASAPNHQAAYVASKGAVVTLTRELAAQWARRGVRVNALAPGYFPSELTAAMLDDERSMAWVRRNTPMGRPGTPARAGWAPAVPGRRRLQLRDGPGAGRGRGLDGPLTAPPAPPADRPPAADVASGGPPARDVG